MAQIDGVFAVDPDESEGFEQRRNLADRPNIDKRRPRPQANFSFATPGSEEVHVLRIQHTVFTSGDVDEDSVGRHGAFVA